MSDPNAKAQDKLVQPVEAAPLVKVPEQPASDGTALMKIIDRAAADPDFDVDKLEKLLAVKERWDAAEARKAYNAAFAAFKSEAIVVVKNKGVSDGPLRGKRYAELFSVVNAVTPLLSKHGLSHSWKLTKDEKDWIEVTCTLTHSGGHSETAVIGGPPDAGGAKNAIQARASTITYLERYSLKAVCGIAEQGDDSDGNSNGAQMDEGAMADHIAAIDAAENSDALRDAFKAAYKAADAAGDAGAKRRFTEHKDQRKKALGASQ